MIGEIRLLGDSSSELPEDFAIPEDFLRFPNISKISDIPHCRSIVHLIARTSDSRDVAQSQNEEPANNKGYSEG
jgi:hypothetical protein